jgi:hypothetical protein
MGPVIVSNTRGVLDAGLRPDISASGEVVYYKEVVEDDRSCWQIFSTTRGQLTFFEDCNNIGSNNLSINSSGEVVYISRDSQNQDQIFSTVRGQLTFVTGGIGEFPEIDDSGRVVFAKHGPDGMGSTTLNIWELDTEGNIRQLTFYNFPEEAEQPTLAAETGELVYIVFTRHFQYLS